MIDLFEIDVYVDDDAALLCFADRRNKGFSSESQRVPSKVCFV